MGQSAAKHKKKEAVPTQPQKKKQTSYNIKVGSRHYSVHHGLGTGGFSEVFFGVDLLTQKQVALKVLSKKATQQEMKSVHKEIKAMKQFNHPHVVRLLGYDLKCEVPNPNGKGRRQQVVIIQELCPNGELFDYLMCGGRFKENLAIPVFGQVLSGLKHIHDRGIAHRDLKPENLLFDAHYNIKIADFGFAYQFQKNGQYRHMKTQLGTYGYMAPELLGAPKHYTKKCDVFAAGVIFFIMLAGFPPFQTAEKKDWWFDKILRGNTKLFWKAHERTVKFNADAKKLLLDMMNPSEANRLSVDEVIAHPFMRQAGILNKTQIQENLKTRRNNIDRTEMNNKEAARGGFGDLLKNLEKYEVSHTGGYKIADVIETDLVKNLKTVGTLEGTKKHNSASKHLIHILVTGISNCSDEIALSKDINESLKNCDSVVAHQIAKKFVQRDFNSLEKFMVGQNYLSQPAYKAIEKALQETLIGDIDEDWDLINEISEKEKMVAQLPPYMPTHKIHTYETPLGIGILFYCLHKYAFPEKGTVRGMLSADYATCTIHFDYKGKKKIVIPKLVDTEVTEDVTEAGTEQTHTTIQREKWIQGKLDCEVKLAFKLSYCARKKSPTNILTIENLTPIAHSTTARQIIKDIVNESLLKAFLVQMSSDDDLQNQHNELAHSKFYAEMKKTGAWLAETPEGLGYVVGKKITGSLRVQMLHPRSIEVKGLDPQSASNVRVFPEDEIKRISGESFNRIVDGKEEAWNLVEEEEIAGQDDISYFPAPETTSK